LVEHQMGGDDLDGERYATQPRSACCFEGALVAEVNDVTPRTGCLEERREVVRALRLDRDRTARFVPLWPGLALGEEAGLQLRDDAAVLAVGGDDDAQLLGQHQRL